MATQGQFNDHYAVLGLKIESDPAEVSTKDLNDAYKKLAKKHHPDKNKGVSHAKFHAISTAIELLRDRQKREQYDDVYRKWKREERRKAAEDERTRKLRVDLERREREDQIQSKTSLDLGRLRRENEGLQQMIKTKKLRSDIKIFTLEQHLDIERDVLNRAMRYPE